MPFISQNPATEEVLATFEGINDAELDEKLASAVQAQREWAKLSFDERKVPMKKLASIFSSRKMEVGRLITLEMGRPISSSPSESEKCGLVADYYAEQAEFMLAPVNFPEGAGEGEVRLEPLGVILSIMPWNYPFWQVMRFAAPALMAGNAVVMKHAANVPQCAKYLETLFDEAGFPKGLFQNLYISIEQVATTIADKRISGVTLTGSVRAGSSVAETAGKHIKKSVLELGGSDPFIVLEDADIDAAAKEGALARLQNAGQTCISAKRFIVHERVYDQFMTAFKDAYSKNVVGDPMDATTSVGPLAGEKFVIGLDEQVRKSVELGASVVLGGKRLNRPGWFYEPTILENVEKGMPAYDEELFGPVASMFKFADDEDAVRLANDTEFGLGASVWTRDMERADKFARALDTGNVFINKMVKSDPRVPFGGVKMSGYGRELGDLGIKEFVNQKTISINRPKETPKETVE